MTANLKEWGTMGTHQTLKTGSLGVLGLLLNFFASHKPQKPTIIWVATNHYPMDFGSPEAQQRPLQDQEWRLSPVLKP